MLCDGVMWYIRHVVHTLTVHCAVLTTVDHQTREMDRFLSEHGRPGVCVGDDLLTC